eukprot:gene6726-4821_t
MQCADSSPYHNNIEIFLSSIFLLTAHLFSTALILNFTGSTLYCYSILETLHAMLVFCWCQPLSLINILIFNLKEMQDINPREKKKNNVCVYLLLPAASDRVVVVFFSQVVVFLLALGPLDTAHKFPQIIYSPQITFCLFVLILPIMFSRSIALFVKSSGYAVFEKKVLDGFRHQEVSAAQRNALKSFYKASKSVAHRPSVIKACRALVAQQPAGRPATAPSTHTTAPSNAGVQLSRGPRKSARSVVSKKKVAGSGGRKSKKFVQKLGKKKLVAMPKPKKLTAAEKKNKRDFSRFRATLIRRAQLRVGPALERRISQLWILMNKKKVKEDQRVSVAIRVLKPSAVKRVSTAGRMKRPPLRRASKSPKQLEEERFVRFRALVLKKSGIRSSPGVEQRIRRVWKLLQRDDMTFSQSVSFASRLLRSQERKADRQVRTTSRSRTRREEPAAKRRSAAPESATASKETVERRQFLLFRDGILSSLKLKPNPRVNSVIRRAWHSTARRSIGFAQRVEVAGEIVKRSLSPKSAAAPAARRAVAAVSRPTVVNAAPAAKKKSKRNLNKKQLQFLAFYRAMMMTGKIPKDPAERAKMIKLLWTSTHHLKKIEPRIKLAEAHLAGAIPFPPQPAPQEVELKMPRKSAKKNVTAPPLAYRGGGRHPGPGAAPEPPPPATAAALRVHALIAAEQSSVVHAEAPKADDQREGTLMSELVETKKKPLSAFARYFANALHAVYVVSLTEKAQHGVDCTSSEARKRKLLVAGTPYLVSTEVTSRWVRGVTQLLRQSLTLDDVARLALVFPQWLHVKWSALPARSIFRPTGMSESIAVERTEQFLEFRARLYLTADHVISVAEAEEYLERELHLWQKSSPRGAGVRDHPVAHCTAQAAYLKQQAQQGVISHGSSSHTDLEGKEEKQCPGSSAPNGETSTSDGAAEEHFEDREVLLSMISPELRMSLSAEKLNALLSQVRREANKEDQKAYERNEAQRVVEQLVEIYQHIRTIFGSKFNVMSLGVAVDRLVDQGYSDLQKRGQVLRAIDELVDIPSSGLSLLQVDSGGSSSPVKCAALSSEELGGWMLCLHKDVASLRSVAEADFVEYAYGSLCPTKKRSLLLSPFSHSHKHSNYIFTTKSWPLIQLCKNICPLSFSPFIYGRSDHIPGITAVTFIGSSQRLLKSSLREIRTPPVGLYIASYRIFDSTVEVAVSLQSLRSPTLMQRAAIGCCCRVLLASSRLPYILCTSTVQSSFPALGNWNDGGHLVVRDVVEDFRRSATSSGGPKGSAAADRETKAAGFNAVLRWCTLYQHPVVMEESTTPTKKKSKKQVAVHASRVGQDVNDAALEWVQESVHSFSCGQSLVLVTLLGDVLYRALRHQKSSTTAPRSDAHVLLLDVFGKDAIEDLISRLHDGVVGLLRHVDDLGSKLEAQPLPLLASGLYAVFRVQDILKRRVRNSSKSAARREENMITALSAPLAALQRAFTLQLRGSLSPSASPTVSSSLEGMMTGNRPLGIKVLLTFFLCVDTATRRATLHNQENYVARAAFQALHRAIGPSLQMQEALVSAVGEVSSGSGAATASNAVREEDGLPEDIEADDTPSVNNEAPDAAEGLGVVLGTDPALRPTTSGVLHTQSYLEECLQIFQNSSSCRPLFRLGLLEYLLLRVRAPASYTEAEAELLPRVLYRFRDIQSQYRHNIVMSLLETGGFLDPKRRSLRTFLRLLPFLYFPQEVVRRSGLGEMSSETQVQIVSEISGVESAEILSSAASFLPSAVTDALQWNILRAYAGAVVTAAEEGRNPGDHVAKGQIGLVIPLVYAMHYFYLTADKKHGFLISTDAGEADSISSNEIPLRDNTLARCYALLVPLLNWEGGVIETDTLYTPSSGPDGDVPYLGDAAALQAALEVYVFLQKHRVSLPARGTASPPEPISIPAVSDKVLFSHYFHLLLLPGTESRMSHQRLVKILQLVVDVIPLLSEPAHRARCMERAIRFNATASRKSFQGVLRFLDIIAPVATEMSLVSSVALTAMLDSSISTLNPQRGLARGHFGSGRTGMHAFGQYYTRVFLSAAKYMMMALSCEQGTKVPKGGKDVMARQLGLWMDDYFRTLFRIESRLSELEEEEEVVEAEGESQEEVVEEHDGDTDGVPPEDLEPEPLAEPVAAGDEDEELIEDDAVGEGNNSLLSLLQAEAIFTAAARVGAHLPSMVFHRVIQERMDATLARISAPPEGGEAETEDVPSPPAGLRVEALPLPAHFIYYVRSGRTFPVPLTVDYLHHLLTVCDIRIFHLTLSAFIIAATAQQAPRPTRRRGGHTPAPSLPLMSDSDILEASWAVVPCAIGALQQRLHEPAAAVLSSAARSAVVTHVFRVLLHQMERVGTLRGASTQRALARSEEREAAPAGEATPEPGEEEPEGEGEDYHPRMDVAALEKELVLCCDYIIIKDHLRNICLTYLDKLYTHFPLVATTLFNKYADKGESLEGCQLTTKELLFLASSYPPAASLVYKELSKQDIKQSVDISELLHQAKSLPMTLTEQILAAHLPSLSFAWCSRLLSALTPRQAELPAPLLCGILDRVQELVSSASDSDRNLLLMVLQGYIRGPSAPMISISPVEAEVVVEEATASAAQLAEEQRTQSLFRCYDAVLKVDSVVDVATLRDFLRVTPSSMHRHIIPALLERVQQHVLPPLLSGKAAADDVTASLRLVLQVTRLLHQEAMLSPGIRHMIAGAVFADVLKGIRGMGRSPGAAPEGLEDGAAPQEGGEGPASPSALQEEEIIAPLVELALLLGKDLHQGVECSPDGALFSTEDAANALDQFRLHLTSAPHKLVMLTTLVDLTNTPTATAPNASSAAAIGGRTAFGRQSQKSALSPQQQQLHPQALYVAPSAVLDRLTQDLVQQCDALSSARLVRLIQCISRMKRWHLVPGVSGSSHAGGNDAPEVPFHQAFRKLFAEADAHTRCVAMRAISTDAPLLHHYEAFMVQPLLDSISVLSYEDLELLLTTILQMQSSSLIEILLDAVGTRIMSILDQCKPSTFVRLLQCHATYGIRDDKLLEKVLVAMEEQCAFREMRLSTLQIIHFLQAVVTLDMTAPERLLLACFNRVEKAVETLPRHQVVQLARLSVDLEMGYNSSVHALVVALQDTRTDYRTSEEEKETIALLCDVYDVEVPFHWRHIKLRDRRKKMRQAEAKFFLELQLQKIFIILTDAVFALHTTKYKKESSSLFSHSITFRWMTLQRFTPEIVNSRRKLILFARCRRMELTEDQVRRSAKQYDVELVHHAPLNGVGIAALGRALERCCYLTVLDVRQNKLTSLNGIELVGGSLTMLNAAENAITDISDLAECKSLTTLYLEGNQLKNAAAVEPLSGLLELRDVFFKRRVDLEGEKNGLLLDNPFCSDAIAYKKVITEVLANVLWVDGIMLRFDNEFSRRQVPSDPLQDQDVSSAMLRINTAAAEATKTSVGEEAFRRIMDESSRAVRQTQEIAINAAGA